MRSTSRAISAPQSESRKASMTAPPGFVSNSLLATNSSDRTACSSWCDRRHASRSRLVADPSQPRHVLVPIHCARTSYARTPRVGSASQQVESHASSRTLSSSRCRIDRAARVDRAPRRAIRPWVPPGRPPATRAGNSPCAAACASTVSYACCSSDSVNTREAGRTRSARARVAARTDVSADDNMRRCRSAKACERMHVDP